MGTKIQKQRYNNYTVVQKQRLMTIVYSLNYCK